MGFNYHSNLKDYYLLFHKKFLIDPYNNRKPKDLKAIKKTKNFTFNQSEPLLLQKLAFELETIFDERKEFCSHTLKNIHNQEKSNNLNNEETKTNTDDQIHQFQSQDSRFKIKILKKNNKNKYSEVIIIYYTKIITFQVKSLQDKHIKLQNFEFTMIDEFNEYGDWKFAENELLKGFQIRVNCIEESALRQKFVRDFKPNFYEFRIFVDPNVHWNRELTFCNFLLEPQTIFRLYNLQFNNSIESAIYQNQIENEEIKGFKKILSDSKNQQILIQDPLQRIKCDLVPQTVSTRQGGFLFKEDIQQVIIVDTREFKSEIPSVLYHKGFQLEPQMLLSGDYILSNDVAVERKCVDTGDFFDSISKGRLESQLIEMQKQFKTIYLLIEYSKYIDFSLQSTIQSKKIFKGQKQDQIQEHQMKMQGTSLISQLLTVIVAKFPRLIILWSKSPLNTALIFAKIKKSLKQPEIGRIKQAQIDKKKQQQTLDYYININRGQKVSQLGQIMKNEDETIN